MGARRFILLSALSCTALLGSAGPAFAHAAYEASEPANGATVSSPPSRVIAEFTEPVVQGSTLTVVDPCGEQVDNGDSLVATDRITVTVSASSAGVYSVTFDVVSAVDGHNTGGTFTFTSSGGDPCPGEEPPPQAPEPASNGGGNSGGGGAAGTDSAGSSGSTGGGSAVGAASSQAGGAREQARSREAGGSGARPRGMRRPGDAAGGEDLSAKVPNVNPASAAGPAEPAAPSVWDGIPMGAFLAALALAALVGAAGGKVYAGIMGWRA